MFGFKIPFYRLEDLAVKECWDEKLEKINVFHELKAISFSTQAWSSRCIFYDDYRRKELYDGYWEIAVENIADVDHGDIDSEYFTDAIFYDRFGKKHLSFYGGIKHLGSNRLHFVVFAENGIFTFKFERQ